MQSHLHTLLKQTTTQRTAPTRRIASQPQKCSTRYVIDHLILSPFVDSAVHSARRRIRIGFCSLHLYHVFLQMHRKRESIHGTGAGVSPIGTYRWPVAQKAICGSIKVHVSIPLTPFCLFHYPLITLPS